jgi:ABC-type sulfate transport system substrate-binding protein
MGMTLPPPCPLQIQCPVALIDANLDTQPPEVREAAVAFVNYCFEPDAQREFGACGFRCARWLGRLGRLDRQRALRRRRALMR